MMGRPENVPHNQGGPWKVLPSQNISSPPPAGHNCWQFPYNYYWPLGGALLFMEEILEDTKDGPAPAHMWELASSLGHEYRLRSGVEYGDLLREAGFKDITLLRTQAECLYDAIFAHKVWFAIQWLQIVCCNELLQLTPAISSCFLHWNLYIFDC